MHSNSQRIRVVVALLIANASAGCSLQSTKSDAVEQISRPDSVATSAANIVRVFVSAVNCEMNTADGARLNRLAATSGLTVEVVFAGSNGDSSVANQAKTDLGLSVSTRMIKSGELEQYKSIGGVGLPVALVIKARQLKTIIAGETMPRTLSLLEASVSPTGGQ